MDLVTPGFGLDFWTTLTLLLLIVLLRKFAWKPILNAVDSRNQQIEESLKAADLAKEEMAKLNDENKKILEQAMDERKRIISDAQEANKEIIAKAKTDAQKEADKIIDSARATIVHEKNVALSQIKDLMADLSIDVAKKVLERELSDDAKQREYAESVLKDVNLN